MPSQFGFLPRSGRSGHIVPQSFESLLQQFNLAASLRAIAIQLQVRDLSLDFFEFLLRFFGGGHA
jgi:hypothetical protein